MFEAGDQAVIGNIQGIYASILEQKDFIAAYVNKLERTSGGADHKSQFDNIQFSLPLSNTNRESTEPLCYVEVIELRMVHAVWSLNVLASWRLRRHLNTLGCVFCIINIALICRQSYPKRNDTIKTKTIITSHSPR